MCKKIIHIFLCIIFLICMFVNQPAFQVMGQTSSSPLNCRFGVTSPYDSGGIDLTSLRIGAFLNWGPTRPSTLQSGIDFIHVLRVSDSIDSNGRTVYENTKDQVETLVPIYPGAYWEIGNEPDTTYSVQDNLTAEIYADRYFFLASRIRALDPTAKLGFGSVVQPTPIRIRYLNKAWTELVSLAGSDAAVSKLIDFWSIHAFILNELPGQWGTGVPKGFENDHADAISSNYPNTYSSSIFSSRVRNFRQWMALKGEQNKPLWITEYGSLLPPVDRPKNDPNYSDKVNVSDTTTRDFMLKTFDFMLNTSDGPTGMPSDNYHLVQRWFWYSLNDHRYSLGGAWYDPDSTPPLAITTVGRGYVNYAPKNKINPEFHFTVNPIIDSNGHTKFEFGVLNSGTSMEGSAKIWAYFDNPNEPPVATINTDSLAGCGGTGNVSFSPSTPPTGVHEVFFRIDTNGDGLPNSGDEIKSINLDTGSGRSPADGKVLLNNRPTFTWDDVDEATSFNLQVSTGSGFTSYVLNTTTSSANYTMTADLASNRLMYWRVRPQIGGVYGPWSTPRSFTTANLLGIPTLVSPSNNALTTNYRPKLDWNNSSLPSGAVFGYYRVQVTTAADNTFTSPIVDAQVFTGLATSEYTPTSDLATNTAYIWRVRAYNNLEQYSVWSSVRSFRTAILPPVLVSPADGDLTIVTRRPVLDWDDVIGASGYSLQISKYPTFSSTVMTGSPTASIFPPTSDLPANTTLYWRVQAKGLNGPSLWSSPVRSFKTGNPPSIPALVSPSNNALVTSYHPKLDWSNSTLPSLTTFKCYQVQVTTAADTTFTSPVVDAQVSTGLATSEYTTSSDYLAPNTNYIWRVRTLNTFNAVDQYSAWSSVYSFRTAILPPVLVSPADGDQTITARRPILDWDDVIGASGYSVQLSKYPSFSSTVKIASTTASTYTPTSDLPANTLLFWRVQAKGVNGPSLWSIPVRSFKIVAPVALTALSPEDNAQVLTGTPTLTWGSQLSAAGMEFAYYQVQVATDETFATPLVDAHQTDQGDPKYTFTNELSPDVKYFWRVRSYNTAGQYSDWSDTCNFRIPFQAPGLTSPVDGTKDVGSQPEFTWNRVDGALDYKVEISSESAFTSIVESGTVKDVTYTSTAVLPAGASLYWRVQADGKSGPGLWSEIYNFTTIIPLEIPTLITPADGALQPDYRPTLTWKPVQLHEGLDFAYYQVQIAVDNVFTTPLLDIQQPDLANSSYTLTDDLSADAIYFWRVKASYSNEQSSEWSVVHSFRTPIQPSILKSPGNGAVDVGSRPELDWQEVIGASGYKVEISSDADFAIVLESGSTKDIVFQPTADFPSNTMLYWRVQAYGNNGPGLWSDSYSFTTQSQ